MRKVDDREEKRKKRMAFSVGTTSLPAVYRPNGYDRTTTAGTPHARANSYLFWSLLSTRLVINAKQMWDKTFHKTYFPT